MDMSLLKPLSEILGVSINEILAGEIILEKDIKNKTEENIINISKLSDLKSTKNGVIALSIVSILLIIYCGIKGISSAGFVSMICGYNGIFYCSKYNYKKDKNDLITGILFLMAMSLNIIAFIISTI